MLSGSRAVDWAALPLPGRGRNLPRGTDRSDSKKAAGRREFREAQHHWSTMQIELKTSEQAQLKLKVCTTRVQAANCP